MGKLIVIDQATKVVSEAAQATVHAGVALLMVAAGVGYGLANGIPEFFKNSYLR